MSAGELIMRFGGLCEREGLLYFAAPDIEMPRACSSGCLSGATDLMAQGPRGSGFWIT